MAIAGGGFSGRTSLLRCSLCAHLAAALLSALGVQALPASGAENYPREKLPRFVSLRSDQVNLRVGPGQTFPIDWVLTRKGMPVEIVKQFENWRMVRVWQDRNGWILDRMVTAERHVIVAGEVRALYRRPDIEAEIVARAEPGVVAKLVECRGEWCRVEAGGYRGWLQRGEVWGLLPDETIR